MSSDPKDIPSSAVSVALLFGKRGISFATFSLNAFSRLLSGRLGTCLHLSCFMRHRGRTASYPTAPAQIPACSFPAPGSSALLASALQLRLSLTLSLLRYSLQ